MAKVGYPWRRLSKLSKMTMTQAGKLLPGMSGTRHTEKPSTGVSNPKK